MRRRWRVTMVVVGAGLSVLAAPPAWALPSQRTPSQKEQARASFEEGHRHQQAKRYQQAIQAYEASLRDDPNQAETLNNLGFCYKSLKRYQKAIGFYQDALRLNPDLAEAHEYLGEAYVELGKLPLGQPRSDEHPHLPEHDRHREQDPGQHADPQIGFQRLQRAEEHQPPQQAARRTLQPVNQPLGLGEPHPGTEQHGGQADGEAAAQLFQVAGQGESWLLGSLSIGNGLQL